jgi:hypothetical protein
MLFRISSEITSAKGSHALHLSLYTWDGSNKDLAPNNFPKSVGYG